MLTVYIHGGFRQAAKTLAIKLCFPFSILVDCDYQITAEAAKPLIF